MLEVDRLLADLHASLEGIKEVAIATNILLPPHRAHDLPAVGVHRQAGSTVRSGGP